ncbi:MAG: hypoxanthine-guanine phosphoribosyltransferase [Pseudomonadota bacterium]|nr:hypoxanthine-guanine phosphoribosyltransferase [Pseudomonadota bacterium]
MTPEAAESLLESAVCVAGTEKIERALSDMAMAISNRLEKSNPVILPVMTGALIFAGHLLPKLTFPLEIDYLQANRYGQNMTGGRVHWRIEPRIDLHGRSVLILDDILDKGITLEAVCKKMASYGASEVLTAVFVNKRLAASRNMKADFIGLELPDRFLFGFGLDIYGYWRNLPRIYAIPENKYKDF